MKVVPQQAMQQGLGGIGQALGGITGGMLGQSPFNISSNMTSFSIQGSPYYSISTSSPNFYGQPYKKIHHEQKTAEAFKSLTAYIRAVLACEPNCECKWCAASELERQMAIAQFFVPEKDDAKEGVDGGGVGSPQPATP